MTDSTTIYYLLPEIILVGAATLLYMLGAFVPLKRFATIIALLALAFAGGALLSWSGLLEQLSATGAYSAQGTVSSGPLVIDLFAYVFQWIVVIIGALLALVLARPHSTEQRAEEQASLLLMLAGLMIVATANELVLLFVGLELVSIPTYVLLYVGKHDVKGQEAASKYFFLSILTSAVLLYGFSFLYGAAGSTRLDKIAQAIGSATASGVAGSFVTALAPVAMLLVFGGLAFRLTAVPFHFYAPDVYQGTSNFNGGLLSTLPKIAGLAALARILLTTMPGWESLGWKIALVVSVITMTLGNIMALWQTNIRRMLAYSSIAHAGYLLIGLAVALAVRTTETGVAAGGFLSSSAAALNGLGSSVFYLAVYMLATLGTFAALVYLSDGQRQIDTLKDMGGLNRTHPVVALIIAAFMFSLAGVPPLAGFWGKFTLLYSALTLDEFSSQGSVWLRPWFVGLAVVAVLNAAISAAYYLRVIGAMYFRQAEPTGHRASRGFGPWLAMTTCVLLVIGFGLLPGRLLDSAVRAGQSLGQPAAAHASIEQPWPAKGALPQAVAESRAR